MIVRTKLLGCMHRSHATAWSAVLTTYSIVDIRFLIPLDFHCMNASKSSLPLHVARRLVCR